MRLPYPGLRAFRHDETELFFGRDSIVKRMVKLLGVTRFLAVLGASGSGKSSVVRTGLIDALELGRLRGAGARWRIVDFSPGGRPMRNLAAKLLGELPQETRLDLMQAFLRRGPRSLIEWCENGNLANGTNLLVLVDQFEELFRYQDYTGRDEAEAFVALLMESARADTVPIYVTMTMRSEYLGACTLIEGLVEEINRGQFLTPRMTREECAEAIKGPAGVCGFSVDAELVNRLLNDLESFAPWQEDRDTVDQLDRLVRRADQLPLLQHALSRMWTMAMAERGERGPLVLTVEDYARIGQLKGTLNSQAQEILDELGERRLDVVQKVFRALTAGSTVADAVRRPTRFGQLVALADGRREDVRAVIDAFGAPGRTLLQAKTEGEIDDDTLIDISHESLIRQWPLLSEWVIREAEAVQTWRRLQDAAALYGSGKGNLFGDLTLANVSEWWEREKPTRIWAERQGDKYEEVEAFYRASLEQERRERERKAAEETRAADLQRRRLRARYLTAVAFLCLVTPLGLFAGYSAYRTNQEALRANQEAARANRQTEAAEAARQAAVAAEEDARRQAADAKAASRYAEEQQRIADAERQRAEAERNNALKAAAQFRVSRARAILEADPDKALQLTLASLPSATQPDLPLLPVAQRALEQVVQRIVGVSRPTRLVPPGLVSGHTGAVHAVDLSPDGRLLLTASADGSAILWSTETGETDKRIKVSDADIAYEVYDAVFSPDGSAFLTASGDGIARLWWVEHGREIRRFENSGALALTAAFSPDEESVAVGYSDGTARIFSVDTEKTIRTLEGHSDYVREVSFSPDGSLLLTTSDDRTAKIWSVATGEIEHTLSGHTEWLYAGAFSPDGALVATGSEAVRIWSVDSGAELRTIQDPAGYGLYVKGLAFSPDGRRLAGGGSGLRIWSVDTGEEFVGPNGSSPSFNDVDFSADGKLVFTASDDFTAGEWTDGGRSVARFGYSPDVVALGMGGDVLAAGSDEGVIRTWSLKDGNFIRALRGSANAPISGIYRRPDGNLLARAGLSVRLWDVATGESRSLVELLPEALCVAFSPDAKMVAIGMMDGTVQVMSLEGEEDPVTLSGHTDYVRSVAFSPDGRYLLSGSDDKTARIWDIETGAVLHVLKDHPDWIYSVAFSPEGRTVAIAGGGWLRVWSADNGRLLQAIASDAEFATEAYAIYSPDGTLLATLPDDGIVRLWSVDLGALILRIENQTEDTGGTRVGEKFTSVAFSPDGLSLAVGSADGMTRVYGLQDPAGAVAQAQELVSQLEPLTAQEQCDYLISAQACDLAIAPGAGQEH